MFNNNISSNILSSNILSPTELANNIKQLLPTTKYKISGEVSQPKLSHGHFYLTIKDANTNLKAIIWKSKIEKINKLPVEGDKIIIETKLDFYNFGGNINLIIENILENKGSHDLDKIKLEFEAKGYFSQDKKLSIPNKINSILILTSANGAAIQDFIFNINNSNMKLTYDIHDVPVQGVDCSKLICEKLKEIYNSDIHYDLIVITRGGGSLMDLIGFSQSELIETVFNYKRIPILSAIGHQVDNPLLDLVADVSCATPSLAAQHIIDINKKYINQLEKQVLKLKETIIKQIGDEHKKLFQYEMKIKSKFNDIVTFIASFENQIKIQLMKSKEKLKNISKSIDTNSKNINLFNLENEKIENADTLQIKEFYLLRWGDKEYKIKIIS